MEPSLQSPSFTVDQTQNGAPKKQGTLFRRILTLFILLLLVLILWTLYRNGEVLYTKGL